MDKISLHSLQLTAERVKQIVPIASYTNILVSVTLYHINLISLLVLLTYHENVT